MMTTGACLRQVVVIITRIQTIRVLIVRIQQQLEMHLQKVRITTQKIQSSVIM